MTDSRTPLIVIAGWSDAAESTARSLLADGTVLVHHDLSHLGEGVVRRTVTDPDGRTRTTVLELAHGCVSCTLREDLLPLLRRLHARSSVRRIVLQLDRTLEPEALCRAVEDVVVAGVVGQLDGPASRDVRIEAVVVCVAADSWLDDATGDQALVERGLGVGDDERTVAQVVVGQVEYADALVVAGAGEDGWNQARLHAVLARLAPAAPIDWIGDDLAPDAPRLLTRIPGSARRGAAADAHAPLLRGQPPLATDCGVSLVEFVAERPFHPERLHEALDVLLDGVVTARGRLWLATQPDRVLWLESAGGGLRVADGGRWLAAMTPGEQEREPTARRAMAAVRWDARFGDRDVSLVVLAHAADPSDIDRALQWALVTDEELDCEEQWPTWPDPFGHWHQDPCASSESPYSDVNREGTA
ncbi:ribosome hibernation factor-recruiting GTPase MRF [Rhodococcus sp. NPDC127528]|uniref:ribosome hibernation factor-recruiting GTPase MRF n=1 Tax=unclassified Rhodococcus (in: high G+C Gram-positive bacteria) TaxID=192944 RepID=UPI0036353F1E